MLEKSPIFYHNKPTLWAIFIQFTVMLVVAGFLGAGCDFGTDKSQKSSKKVYLDLLEQNASIYLTELYKEVMEEEPDFDKKGSSYIDALVQGASRQGVYHGFVLSRTYKEKASAGFTPDSKVIQFLKNTATKYFKQKVSINQNNRFALKRDFAKALLMEWENFAIVHHGNAALIRDKRAQWFGSVAASFAGLGLDLGAPMRNLKDLEKQKTWAKRFSEDKVTSELMVRAHILINRLSKAE